MELSKIPDPWSTYSSSLGEYIISWENTFFRWEGVWCVKKNYLGVGSLRLSDVNSFPLMNFQIITEFLCAVRPASYMLVVN